jgi:hypothetical protein
MRLFFLWASLSASTQQERSLSHSNSIRFKKKSPIPLIIIALTIKFHNPLNYLVSVHKLGFLLMNKKTIYGRTLFNKFGSRFALNSTLNIFNGRNDGSFTGFLNKLDGGFNFRAHGAGRKMSLR